MRVAHNSSQPPLTLRGGESLENFGLVNKKSGPFEVEPYLLLPPCVANVADGPRDETDFGERRHDDDERPFGERESWHERQSSGASEKEERE